MSIGVFLKNEPCFQVEPTDRDEGRVIAFRLWFLGQELDPSLLPDEDHIAVCEQIEEYERKQNESSWVEHQISMRAL